MAAMHKAESRMNRSNLVELRQPQRPRRPAKRKVLGELNFGEEQVSRRHGNSNLIVLNPGDMDDENGPQRRRTDEERRIRRMKWNSSIARPRGELAPNIQLGPNAANNNPVNGTVKAVIIGHSFVSRLRKRVKERMTPADTWADMFNLDGVELQLEGIAGAKIGNMDAMAGYIRQVRPDIVILDLGSNDLCGPNDIAYMAGEMSTNCCSWVDDMNAYVKSLVWCHVTKRLKLNSPHKTLATYNTEVATFNQMVVNGTALRRELHHWKHSGLTNPTWEMMEDGVHPDTTLGSWRYQKSLSRAIKFAKNNIV